MFIMLKCDEGVINFILYVHGVPILILRFPKIDTTLWDTCT